MHYSMVCRTHEVENCEYSIKVSAGLDLYVVLDRSRSKTKLPNLPSARIASTLLCLCQHLKRSERRAGRHHVDPIVLILRPSHGHGSESSTPQSSLQRMHPIPAGSEFLAAQHMPALVDRPLTI